MVGIKERMEGKSMGVEGRREEGRGTEREEK